MRGVIILTIILLLSTIASAEFYEPFVRNDRFTGDLFVGDTVDDVRAATTISVYLQQVAPQSSFFAQSYLDFEGQEGVVIYSGDVEEEFIDVCDVSVYDYFVGECGNHVVIYSRDDIIGLAQTLVEDKPSIPYLSFAEVPFVEEEVIEPNETNNTVVGEVVEIIEPQEEVVEEIQQPDVQEVVEEQVAEEVTEEAEVVEAEPNFVTRVVQWFSALFS